MRHCRRAVRGLLALLVLVSATVQGHGVEHRVEHREAVVVTLQYASGRAFSHEAYEIYQPGSDTPFQVGQTDAQGRLAFVPHQAGRWQVEATSPGGHGTRFELQADPANSQVQAADSSGSHLPAALLGVVLILGLFAALALWYRRRGP